MSLRMVLRMSDLEEVSEDAFERKAVRTWKKEISLEIFRKFLRMVLRKSEDAFEDSLLLEERDLSGDLEEVSEDAFERQSV